MNYISNVQRLLAQNRDHISAMQNCVKALRILKRIADTEGDLEEEYMYHNDLQKAKKDLAKAVDNQKFLKQLMKSL